jgi:hypothetical protein
MPPALSAMPRAHDASFADGVEKYTIHVLRGERRIREYEAEIQELRQRVGLLENPLLSLDFFLGRVKLFPGNQPVVLLVRSPERLEAAIYLYEMKWLGMPTGYFRSFDHLTGESCVVAPEHSRLTLLQVAFYRLFERRDVRVAWATVSLNAAEPVSDSQQRRNLTRFEVSSHCREHRLLLADSFNATLGRFGQHTRRNLRYYRRRAEKDLNAVFHAELSSAQGSQALEQLSQFAFQPFPISLTEWRRMDGLLRTQPGFFAIGLRSGERWLSYLAGVRSGDQTYVLMQINHNGFGRYSLSTVLRSYFFEHEISREQTQIKFVNGTCALFQRVCQPDTCVTVSARRGLMAFVISKFIAPWHSAPDHALNIERWQRQA